MADRWNSEADVSRCEILGHFVKAKDPIAPAPCASAALKAAVTKLGKEGVLAKKSGGWVLTEAGRQLASGCGGKKK